MRWQWRPATRTLFELLPRLHPINARKILEVGGSSRLVHLLRTTPPPLTGEAVKVFDTMMADSLGQILGLGDGEQLGSTATLIAGQPVRHGGLGVRWSGPLRKYAYDAAESEEPQEQHERAEKVATDLNAALMHALPEEERATARACKSSISQGWLRNPPRPAALPITASAARGAMRRRCFVAEEEAYGLECRCGHIVHEGSRHVLHCTRHGKTHTHDSVATQLRKALQDVGYSPQWAPRLAAGSNERPDLQYISNGQDVIVDVTIVTAAAYQYQRSATAANGREAVNAAERAKITKNRAFAEYNDARFVPFGMEAQGSVGQCGLNWLSEVARESDRFRSGREIKRWVDGVVANCQAAMFNGHQAMYRNLLAEGTPGRIPRRR